MIRLAPDVQVDNRGTMIGIRRVVADANGPTPGEPKIAAQTRPDRTDERRFEKRLAPLEEHVRRDITRHATVVLATANDGDVRHLPRIEIIVRDGNGV